MMRFHPFAHGGLKIASVLLAVLLWMMVSTQRASVERGVRIPLELQNLPDNLEMVEPPQESVDVRVRGTADTLSRLTSGDLVATIDLGSAQPGRRLFHLSPERVKAPFAVEVTQVTPASVAIRFESSASRIVAVHPSVEGQPAEGYIVGRISSDPPTVEVVGPESALRAVTEAITEPIWVGGVRSSVNANVIVGVDDQGVRVKTTRTALVTVEIVPAPEERQLSSVPVRLRNLDNGLSARVSPPAIRARVRGTREAMTRFLDSSVIAYVDLEGVGEGDYGLPVRVEAMAGVSIDQLDPTIVHIHVE